MPITRAYAKAGSPLQGLANPVINGGFDIWQRGTSFALTSASGAPYTADRWTSRTDGATAQTYSRQTTSDTTNLPQIQYCMRVARNSGSTSTALAILETSLETVNSIPFAGQTVTLSFYARRGANFSGSSNQITANLKSGTGTDQFIGSSYTGSVTAIGQTPTLTTTWQRFSYSATIATTATELGLQFYYTPSGTAGAADYFEITGVQIDLGTYTAATAPEFRRSGGTLAGELAACQRYYCKTYNIDVAPGTSTENGIYYFSQGTDGQGYALSTIDFPVVMRTAPTVTTYNGTGTSGNWKYARSGVSPTDTATTVDPIGTRQARIYGATGGNYVVCTFSGHFVASAEL